MGGCGSRGAAKIDVDIRRPSIHASAGESVGAGGGSLNLDEGDKNFRTFVYRKRRLSDATLEKVLLDPVVLSTFKHFLHGEFGEHKLSFWLAADQFRRASIVEPDITKVQEKAQELYDRYIAREHKSGFVVEIDSATREQIAADLKVDPATGKVGCNNRDTLQRVFLLAALKTFQDIKFNYLPVFVTSSEFAKLRGEDGFFRDVEDAKAKISDVLKGMNMDYALEHPVGYTYVSEFARKGNLFDGQGGQLVDLYMEVAHYLSETEATRRGKRLARIVRRYSALDVPELQTLVEAFDGKSRKFTEPESKLLVPVKEAIVTKFSAHEKDFKSSTLFTNMANNIASSSVSSFKANSFKKMLNTKRTLEDLKRFSEVRNLKEAQQQQPVTLQRVLENSQGLCFFKRFAIQNFMEDSIAFWIAVRDFKSVVQAAGAEKDADFMQSKGQLLVSRFLDMESDMVVNVSSEMREAAVERFRDPARCCVTVFDGVRDEVTRLMEHNLWKKFAKTPSYDYLVERLRERDFIRDTQGHVGQYKLAENDGA